MDERVLPFRAGRYDACRLAAGAGRFGLGDRQVLVDGRDVVVGVADSGPYVEDAWWVTAEVLRMLYTDAIPGVQGDDLTTELQSSGSKAVFSAAGTLTAPYTLRMQMTWLPAEVETGGSYEFPQTFYVDGRFYTAEKLEFFLSA